jgi:hypothetical protein
VWESTLRSFRCTTRSPLIPTPLTRFAFRERELGDCEYGQQQEHQRHRNPNDRKRKQNAASQSQAPVRFKPPPPVSKGTPLMRTELGSRRLEAGRTGQPPRSGGAGPKPGTGSSPGAPRATELAPIRLSPWNVCRNGGWGGISYQVNALRLLRRSR